MIPEFAQHATNIRAQRPRVSRAERTPDVSLAHLELPQLLAVLGALEAVSNLSTIVVTDDDGAVDPRLDVVLRRAPQALERRGAKFGLLVRQRRRL